MSRHRPRRIVSGGQTGADRGGLEAALALGISHGGWCPSGRRAEDGEIPARYELEETSSEEYGVRTRWNVRDSDATVLFTRGTPRGGSALTAELARSMRRPLLHIDTDSLEPPEAAALLRVWLAEHAPHTLNVAGSRESQCPGLAEFCQQVLVLALGAD